MSIFTATTAPVSARATRPVGPEVIARIMHMFATSTAEQALEVGEMAVVVEVGPSQAAHGVPDREI